MLSHPACMVCAGGLWRQRCSGGDVADHERGDDDAHSHFQHRLMVRTGPLD